jgi:Fe-S cluster assembly scaffold protein SufB
LSEGELNTDISVKATGLGAKSEILLAEVGRKQAKMHTRIENICQSSLTSGNIITYSMMMDEAFSQVQGAPVVEKNAADCVNHLLQKSMLLSSKARIDLVPLLSVANKQVQCSHRAEITHLSDEDLFYFANRGIAAEFAKHLLLDGFLNTLLQRIGEPGIRECIGKNTHHFLQRGVS